MASLQPQNLCFPVLSGIPIGPARLGTAMRPPVTF